MLIGTIILLTLILYWDLPFTFFQQDEWQFFGAAISALASSNPILNTILPFGGELTHFYPLSTLFFLLEYTLFKVNFPPYGLMAIFLHSVNGFLVYILIKKITNIKLISLATTALFLVNSFSHQATSWILAADFTLTSSIFILLSLISFVDFLHFKKKIYYFYSLSFLLIALLFKEISIFLFLFYPICFYLFNNQKSHRIFKPLLSLAGLGVFYILLRLFFLLFSVRSSQPEIGDVSAAPPIIYLLRFLTVPLKGLTQSFFPQGLLINISDKLIEFGFPKFVHNGVADPTISQTIGFDLVSYFLGTVLIITFLLIFKYFNKRFKELIYLIPVALLFLLISFLPFIFIPGKAGYFSIFEPRNLYIASISSSLLIVIILYIFVHVITKRAKIKKLLFGLLLSPFLILNIQAVRADLRVLKSVGQIRESLLTKIERDNPVLPNKVIIYTQSDRPYYGISESEKILPVQSGFGRMVMVWYQQRQVFPACLYEDQFLQDLLAEGYKECKGVGFGYFRDYNRLMETIKIKNYPIENVVSYQWDGQANQLDNITDEIKDKLRKDLRQ